MLVLTRKVKQSLMIGDDVEVTVLSVDGTKVRLGIEAPTNIPVYRTEIYLEIRREREQGIRREPAESDEDAVRGRGGSAE